MIAVAALPLVVLPKWLQVVACILVWLGASAGWGYLGHRLPTSRFDHDTWWSRLRGPERSGRLYERLGIKRFKAPPCLRKRNDGRERERRHHRQDLCERERDPQHDAERHHGEG